MKLYVAEMGRGGNSNVWPVYRPASPAEILEAARPHADLEAAHERLLYLDWERMGVMEAMSAIEEAVLAALGADDEEDDDV